ncbi:uncharacterized protein LOC6582592 [Drosophila mojavensis]|uniref:uncharacterized protein LOC6582592 n=1 Tax=Drosophila mojavensis TaxID=7230 RepID=UPI001CD16BEE|nr:uncharacterized protein LOC6582592 [Drosophila mojavensis]
MNKPIWLWLLAVVAVPATSQAKRRPVIIQIRNFSCSNYIPSLLPELSCSSNKKSGEAMLSACFSLSEAIEQFNLMVDFDIIKKDNSKINIQHVKLDGCQYLSSACKKKFQSGIFETLFKTSNLPRECPIQPNILYEVRNYTITLENIPMAMPALTFQVKTKFFRLKQALGDVLIVASARY